MAFNTNGYITTHRRIFEGVFKHAGELRKYDITKKEWVLKGDTVNYLNWEDLRRAIDYDIQQEKDFSYKGLTDHSWYFRNALVRANYKNSELGIDYDYQYLERFFRNLLLGEDNELKNRYLIINAPDNWNITRESTQETNKNTQEKLGKELEYILEKLGKRANVLGKKLGKIKLR